VEPEFALVLGIFGMGRVDPWPQHVMVVVHIFDEHAIVLNGSLNVRREVDAEDFLIRAASR
jgi:hypothetical protein